jgi:hypothetical protein
MLGRFVKLTPIIGRIVRLIALEGMSGLNEPIAQVGIAFAAEMTVLAVEAAGVVGWPPQAGVFSHGGLAIAIDFGALGLKLAVELRAADKALGVLDFA